MQNTTAHSLLVAWRGVPGATGYRVTWRLLSGECGVWAEGHPCTPDRRVGAGVSHTDPSVRPARRPLAAAGAGPWTGVRVAS